MQCMQSTSCSSDPRSRAGWIRALTLIAVMALLAPASPAAGVAQEPAANLPRNHDFAGINAKQVIDFDGTSRLRRQDQIVMDLLPGTDLKGENAQFWFVTQVHPDEPGSTRTRGRHGTADISIDCFGTSGGVFQAGSIANGSAVFNSVGGAAYSIVTAINVPCDRVQFRVDTAGNMRTIGKGSRVHMAGVAPRPTSCPDDPATLCLQGGRFQIQADWATNRLQGDGFGVPMGDAEGVFYFFDPDNAQLLVSMIDGCTKNDRFWVFAGGLTNVELTLMVTDTQEGKTMTYFNPLGTPLPAIMDTNAFATCP